MDGTPDALTVVVNKGLDDKLRQAVTVLAQQQALNAAITRAGGDPAVVASAVAAAKVDVRSLKPPPPYQKERIALGLLAGIFAVSYTHLRAHETRHDLVCRLLLEK